MLHRKIINVLKRQQKDTLNGTKNKKIMAISPGNE